MTSGAVRIFIYNWPTYLGTWGVAAVAMAAAARFDAPFGGLLAASASLAILWSWTSLAVSFYIYDRSPLAAGTWVRGLLPVRTENWAAVDAGLDAEVALEDAMPGRCVARLDVYDGRLVGRGSVRRARRATPRRHEATPCQVDALPVADATLDVVVVAFAAHEIQQAADRDRFFLEVRRVLRVGGRLILVEHLRDANNFLAFGPGFLHFLPSAEWRRCAEVARLVAVMEPRRVTPWVTSFVLERAT